MLPFPNRSDGLSYGYEHDIRQLVIFAFISDGRVESFERVLHCVDECIRNGKLSTEKNQIPRAFIVDRCQSQFWLLELAFPDSRKVLCAKYLTANLHKTLPTSPISTRFSPMIHADMMEGDYLLIIDQELCANPSAK
jgi:hypothetical protein